MIGIGGSLLYFIDSYDDGKSPYDADFEWIGARDPKPEGVGFYYLDHLTHNVVKGNMDTWFKFYCDTFNFREIRFFDIAGKFTGLLSRALTSPCGKIRIPINEDRGDKDRSSNTSSVITVRAFSTSPSRPRTSTPPSIRFTTTASASCRPRPPLISS